MGIILQRQEGGEERAQLEGEAADSRPGGRTGPIPVLGGGYCPTEFVGFKVLDFIFRHPSSGMKRNRSRQRHGLDIEQALFDVHLLTPGLFQVTYAFGGNIPSTCAYRPGT